MIVRAEAQLQGSIKDVSNIRTELSKIYEKIEIDAKEVVKMGSDIGALKESMINKVNDLDRKIESLKKTVEDVQTDVTSEIKSREVFQGEILASARTTRIITATISGILGLIASMFGILAYFKGQ